MSDLTNLLLLAGAFGLLFALAELLHRRFGVHAETTRKLVHVGTGALTLLFPVYMQHTSSVALLCGTFLAILIISLRSGMLPSINAIRRKSWGSLLYPVIVFIVFLFYERHTRQPGLLFHPYFYFYAPVLVMAICDPLAALAGHAFRRRYPQTFPGKTMAGSFTFFFSAALVMAGLAALFARIALPYQGYIILAIMAAFLSALAERFSDKGWDNFTIPLSVILVIYLIENGLKSFAV